MDVPAATLDVDVDLANDTAMMSPTHTYESLRLSEIESAQLCPSARMKLEELFRQWLTMDGTKEMIQTLVEDLRAGKDLQLDALWAATSTPPTSADGHYHHGVASSSSPSRSPTRPPNYHHFSLGSSGSPHLRRKPHVSLFGDELHAAIDVPDANNNRNNNKSQTSENGPSTEDVVMNDEESSNNKQQKPQERDTVVNDENNATMHNEQDQLMQDESNSAAEGSKLPEVPRFYVPGEGRRGRLRGLSIDGMAKKVSDIETRFRDFPDGMKVEDFVAITKDLCGFPSFFNAPFFRRILSTLPKDSMTPPSASPTSPAGSTEPTAADDMLTQRITKGAFLTYWKHELAPYDSVERFFRVVKQPTNDYIERDDFAPFLHELLKYHPGLEFLSGTPEFQEKYDRDSSGKITLRKLRRSNLIDAFNCVDEEEDINKVNSYFSYEHFYVLYCKFWELDTDHDFLLSQDDLVRYGGHSLTRIIVDRIFEEGRRPFARVQTLTPEEKKKMSYEDFIYFMLSEEDKSNPVSIQYWFELIDTNEDGVIRADEMRAFYRHQIHRMECLGHEVVPFEDILCQMSDLLHPSKEGEFYHKDFIREDKIRVSGVFFNVLFNLSKFIEFEQRDPFLLRQQLAEPELTDWDRYARAEYARLAMEEEGRDEDTAMDIDTMDGWYVSDEPEDDIEIMGNNSTASSSAGGSRTVEAPF